MTDGSETTTANGINIAMALGELTGAVKGIQETVKDIKDDVSEERRSSQESRRRMHDKIDGLKDNVHEIDKKVSHALDLDARLILVEAEVAKTRRIREILGMLAARGWKISLGIAGVTAGGAALWFWKQIAWFFGKLAVFFS